MKPKPIRKHIFLSQAAWLRWQKIEAETGLRRSTIIERLLLGLPIKLK